MTRTGALIKPTSSFWLDIEDLGRVLLSVSHRATLPLQPISASIMEFSETRKYQAFRMIVSAK
jgi:hypothetical protein